MQVKFGRKNADGSIKAAISLHTQLEEANKKQACMLCHEPTVLGFPFCSRHRDPVRLGLFFGFNRLIIFKTIERLWEELSRASDDWQTRLHPPVDAAEV